MHITIEVSKPFQIKPGYYRCKGVTTIRLYWLWFAVSLHPMRQDELLSGDYSWEYRGK